MVNIKYRHAYTQALTDAFISFAVSFLLMKYRADTSQKPRSLDREEKEDEPLRSVENGLLFVEHKGSLVQL